MENPGVVGIAGGRGVVAVPASVVDSVVLRFSHDLRLAFGFKNCALAHGSVGAAPVLQVEGRIGHDVVGLEVGGEHGWIVYMDGQDGQDF